MSKHTVPDQIQKPRVTEQNQNSEHLVKNSVYMFLSIFLVLKSLGN